MVRAFRHPGVGACVVVAMLHVSGCALMPKSAKGDSFAKVAVPPGKAVVYFFRPDRFAMSANTIFMSIPHEANIACPMVTAGYHIYVGEPGTLTVSYAEGGLTPVVKKFTLELKDGDERYIKIDFGKWGPVVEYEEIPADKALPIIAQYRLIGKCE